MLGLTFEKFDFFRFTRRLNFRFLKRSRLGQVLLIISNDDEFFFQKWRTVLSEQTNRRLTPQCGVKILRLMGNCIIEFSAIWQLNSWTNRGTMKVKNVIWERFWTEIVFVPSFAIDCFAMSTPVRQVKEIGCGPNRGKSEIWFMQKKNKPQKN